MPGRDDDDRYSREYETHDRARRELEAEPRGRRGQAGRFNSDQARYYGAEPSRSRLGDYPGRTGQADAWRAERGGGYYDQDRAGYGGQARGPSERSFGGQDRYGYGGQEYGLESRGSGRRSSGDLRWRDDGGAYGDTRMEHEDRGLREFGVPHDYGYHPHVDERRPEGRRERPQDRRYGRDERSARDDDRYGRRGGPFDRNAPQVKAVTEGEDGPRFPGDPRVMHDPRERDERRADRDERWRDRDERWRRERDPRWEDRDEGWRGRRGW